MIDFINVSKQFDNRYVLKNINLNFPRYGLVIINGPSGCGKSTLLNILATLLDFDGEICFDGQRYSSLDKDEKEIIRSQKVGFIFQDYKLFEFETVKENISLSIDIASGDKKAKKDKRIKDLSRLVNLKSKENEFVSNLSGGEKQRVAIARALANSPKVLLADEPTGNLDEYNTKNVMEIIQKISSSALVIMVSHDEKLTSEYADQIIKMKDGEVIDVIYQNKREHHQYLPVINLSYRNKNRLLPFNFLMKHTLNSINRKKWRTMFITLITSLGLIGIGLASTLSSIISDNLYRSYSSIIDDDRLIMSSKEVDNSRDIVTSMSYDDVISLCDNNEDIDYVGVCYANNFDQFFTYNDVAVDTTGTRKTLNGLSIKLINEFSLLNSSLNVIPHKFEQLENNEFVLSAPFSFVNEICFQLQIERTLDSFSRYLERNEIYLSFQVENENWRYAGDFSIKLSGFILSNQILFYHTNPLWNEYIFETKLTLPTTNKLNVNSEHPWDLKKGYYLSFKQNRDKFLMEHRFSFESKDIDFEILDSKYYPNLFINYETVNCNRLLAVNRTKKDYIPSFLGQYSKEASSHIKHIIYGSSNAYAIYDKSLMAGFARNTYLSNFETNIEDVVDLLSYVKYENSQQMRLPTNTIEGHFSKSSTQGLVFEPNYHLISGKTPSNFQEIVVSQAIINKLNLDSPINKSLFLCFPVTESLLPNGYLSRDFKTVTLKIVGVSNSAKLALHHDESWSVLFFQSMLGISTFELNIENLSIQIDKEYESSVIDKLNRAFPQFEVTSPLKDVRESVDRICHYVEVILLVVSIASVIIASFILFICNYLHFLEAKKDIGLVRCLGIKEKESRKFIFAHSFMMTLFSLILSSLELLVISFILSKTVASNLHIEQVFILNPMSFVYMLLVDLFIAIISSILISFRISKYSPLECLT